MWQWHFFYLSAEELRAFLLHVPGTGYTPLPLESAADKQWLPAAKRVLHCQVKDIFAWAFH